MKDNLKTFVLPFFLEGTKNKRKGHNSGVQKVSYYDSSHSMLGYIYLAISLYNWFCILIIFNNPLKACFSDKKYLYLQSKHVRLLVQI